MIPPVHRPDVCGTYRGYSRHRYYDEQPCDACHHAGLAYNRTRKRLRRTKRRPVGFPKLDRSVSLDDPDTVTLEEYRRMQEGAA